MVSDPVKLHHPIFEANRRKIYKWIFMLLQQHHERLGLKVCAWSGPEGINTPRFSLFFDRVRQSDGSPQFDFKLGADIAPMHFYQWAIGVFKPLADAPQLHPSQSSTELRTEQMVPWLNEQLRIVPIYQSVDCSLLPYTDKDDALWHHRAERYLLSWNVLGLYLKSLPQYIRLETVGGSSWSYSEPPHIKDAERFLPEVDRYDILVFCHQSGKDWTYWLHSGRIVRKDGESLDFYQLNRGGLSLDDVVKRVAAFMGDPSGFAEDV